MQRRTKVALALALLAAGPGLYARQQAPAAPARQAGRFAASASGVVVDVIVRDKKGPVMDLNPEDFAITEDGKPQEIVSFERHMVADTSSSGGTTTMTGPASAKPVGPQMSIVALAYDRLSPEGRNLAYKASLAFLKNRK